MSYRTKAIEKALSKVEIKADPEKKKRIQRAKKDFWFFCFYYLRHKFTNEPAPFHRIVIDIYNKRKITKEHIQELKNILPEDSFNYVKETEKLEGLVNCWPREHAKTTIAEAYILWNAIFKKEKVQLIIASSKEMAQNILENIKSDVEEGVYLYEDFGELKGEKWKNDEIQLSNGSIIIAKGIDSSFRGLRKGASRPSLILLDDVMKDETAYSPTLREKIYRKFKRAVLPLSRDAFIIITNTILHNDDLPSRLLREIEEGKLKDWAGLRFEAITPKGQPLWPSHWPLEKLLKKKEELGSIAFAQEYLNRPLSDEDRLFREEWIDYYEDRNLPEDLTITAGVDPATGKLHGDYSAIVVIGKGRNGIIYILETYVKKVSPQRFMEALFDVYKRWKPKVIVFEEVAFQEVYKKFIIEEGSKRGIHLPIKGIKPKGSKELRASKLSPLVENGLIKFKKNQKELIEQLLSFPKGAHDDAVDALVYAVDGLELSARIEAIPVKNRFYNDTSLIRRTIHWLKNLP